jgi:hypothetical protein
MPVLDSPQRLQLHSTLDANALFHKGPSSDHNQSHGIFWIDKSLLLTSLKKWSHSSSELDSAAQRRIQEIIDESWDLFLSVFMDGSFAITAVAVSLNLI